MGCWCGLKYRTILCFSSFCGSGTNMARRRGKLTDDIITSTLCLFDDGAVFIYVFQFASNMSVLFVRSNLLP